MIETWDALSHAHTQQCRKWAVGTDGCPLDALSWVIHLGLLFHFKVALDAHFNQMALASQLGGGDP